MTRDAFGGVLRASGSGFDDDRLDEYWRAFTSAEGRRGQLDLYRSGDFSKLEAYEGRLAGLGVPTLILWGEQDEFAPVAGAYRFQKEIPGSELVLIDDAGHFAFEDAPDRCSEAIVAFLDRASL
jgi:haloalkane dehalogenase